MRQLRAWFLRLRGLFGKERRERELAAEMESHLQMHIEDNLRAGMSAAEARRHALIKLGGIEQTKENYRDRQGLPYLETLIQDLRFGVRMLQKNPGFSLIAVFTLALGIAANATIFSFVSAVMFRKPTVSDPDRLMVVYGTNSTHLWGTYQNPVSAPNFFTWKKENRVFSDVAAADAYETANLTGLGEPERVSTMLVTANYFWILGVSPALGRTFAPGEDQSGNDHVVVLSHELWARRYGSDPKLVGATVRLNGESYTVIGVMPSGFLLLTFQAQLWRPLVLDPVQQGAAGRENRELYLFARLKPGVSATQAQADIGTLGRLAAEAFPEAEKGWGAATLPLQQFMIQEWRPGEVFAMFCCAGFVVLLIACANIAGLLLARATVRGKEIAIRMAIGAGPGRMIRQLLTEAGLIALLGGALGLVLTFWGARFVELGLALNEEARALQVKVDRHVLLFTTAISLFTAILFGLAPALRGDATDVYTILKNDSATVSAGRGRSRLRRVLVAGEVALAVFLLTGAGLLIKAVYNEIHSDLGFDPQHLLTARITLPDARYGDETKQAAFFHELLGKLEALPGVESAAVTSNLPATGYGTLTFRLKGQEDTPAGERPRARYYAVSPGYLQTAGIRLIAGRGFTKEDGPNAPPVALVSEFLARRFFPSGDAVGKQILIDTSDANEKHWREIVGVVGNVKNWFAQAGTDPEIYESFLQKPGIVASVMVRANSNPDSLAPGLREAVWAMDRDQPLGNVISMQGSIAEANAGIPVIEGTLGICAGLALVLAGIGLYGLVSYSVGQRSQEIGIRIALGAEKKNILRLVLRDGMKLALIGVAIGLVGAFPLPRVLRSIFPDFHTAGGGWIFIPVSALIGVVVVLACYIPARRAMRVDPMTALRYE